VCFKEIKLLFMLPGEKHQMGGVTTSGLNVSEKKNGEIKLDF
jgi:hypothetical protein